jgi:hypothetical protein
MINESASQMVILLGRYARASSYPSHISDGFLRFSRAGNRARMPFTILT